MAAPDPKQSWSRQPGARSGRVLTCRICGADFYVEPYRLRSTILPIYCSLQCAGPVRDFATHCLHGHEYEPDNVWCDRRGRRRCRICSRAEWYARTGHADKAEALRLFGATR